MDGNNLEQNIYGSCPDDIWLYLIIIYTFLQFCSSTNLINLRRGQNQSVRRKADAHDPSLVSRQYGPLLKFHIWK